MGDEEEDHDDDNEEAKKSRQYHFLIERTRMCVCVVSLSPMITICMHGGQGGERNQFM